MLSVFVMICISVLGNAYMHQVSDAVKEGHEDGVLESTPNTCKS